MSQKQKIRGKDNLSVYDKFNIKKNVIVLDWLGGRYSCFLIHLIHVYGQSGFRIK